MGMVTNMVGLCNGMHIPRSFEQIANLVIGRLREVVIPYADSVKRFRRAGADSYIGFVLEFGTCLGRADRHGHDNLRGALLPQTSNGGAHGRTGGQAVIDKNDSLAAHVISWSVTAIHAFTSFKFGPFLCGHGIDYIVRNTPRSN